MSAPTISSVNKLFGPPRKLIIKGTGFIDGTNVYIDEEIFTNGFQRISDVEISVNFPYISNTDDFVIRVDNDLGTSENYTVFPVIFSVSKNGNTLIIYGINFYEGSMFRINNIAWNYGFERISNQEIRVNYPSFDIEEVKITNSFGHSEIYTVFPSIENIIITDGVLTITGTKFYEGSTVIINDTVQTSGFELVSENEIRVDVPVFEGSIGVKVNNTIYDSVLFTTGPPIIENIIIADGVLTINGTNFVDFIITFNEENAIYASDGESIVGYDYIRLSVPTVSGTYVVSNSFGSASYPYSPPSLPTISSIVKNGNNLIITGTNFIEGSTVAINNDNFSSGFQRISNEEIRVDVPQIVVSIQVVVMNTFGNSDVYVIGPPTIENINIFNGKLDIFGFFFTGATIRFNGNIVIPYSINTEIVPLMKINLDIPNSSGSFNVSTSFGSVENSLFPTISSLTKNENTLIIRGANFIEGSTVSIDNVNYISGFQRISDEEIRIDVPNFSVNSVRLYNTLGISGKYTVNPTITNVIKDKGPPEKLIIRGTNFYQGSTVEINNYNFTSGFQRISDEEIRIDVPNFNDGNFVVKVMNIIGVAVSYQVNLANISFVTKNGNTILITGTNFITGSTVKINGTVFNSGFQRISNSEIQIVDTNLSRDNENNIKVLDVEVTTSSGASNVYVYIYPPSIEDVIISNGNLIVRGRNFIQPTLEFDGVVFTEFTYTNSQIVVVIPTNKYSITIRTSYGVSSYSIGPRIDSITKYGDNLKITGKNFIDPTVELNNFSVLSINSNLTEIIVSYPNVTVRGTHIYTVTTLFGNVEYNMKPTFNGLSRENENITLIGTNYDGASVTFIRNLDQITIQLDVKSIGLTEILVADPKLEGTFYINTYFDSLVYPYTPLPIIDDVIISGTKLNIIGRAFINVSVKFNSVPQTMYQLTDTRTSILVDLPNVPGTFVVKTNEGSVIYNYTSPDIENIIQNGNTLIITGTNLGAVTTVRFFDTDKNNSTDITNFTYLNNKITLTPTHSGRFDLTVTSSAGSSSKLITVILSPTISSIDKVGNNLIIRGTNFINGITTVYYDGNQITDAEITSEEILLRNTNRSGEYIVRNSQTLYDTKNYIATPIISDIDKVGKNLIIKGENFVDGTTVRIGGIEVGGQVTSTQITTEEIKPIIFNPVISNTPHSLITGKYLVVNVGGINYELELLS